MAKHIVFMANGCEEIEALTTVDILRRVGDVVDMVSITEDLKVEGSHGIVIMADKTCDSIVIDEYDSVILPGGSPGYINLAKSEFVKSVTSDFDQKGKIVAAICASPTVLGGFGLLEGREATCYPGMEDGLEGARFRDDSVVWDGNILTSRGLGTAIDFALELVWHFHGENEAATMAQDIVYIGE